MNNYYTKETMERFLNPKNMGEMDDANGVGKVGNPRCGDQMKVYVKIEKGKIKKASFQTLGCVAAIATSDVICEMIIGNIKPIVLAILNSSYLFILSLMLPKVINA